MLLQCSESSSEIEIKCIFIKVIYVYLRRSERSRELKYDCTNI